MKTLAFVGAFLAGIVAGYLLSHNTGGATWFWVLLLMIAALMMHGFTLGRDDHDV